MKILFVSAVLPYPLRSGGQIRIYNLLKRLSARHEITLVSFIRKDQERGYEVNLSFCKKVVMVRRGSVWQIGYILRALGVYPLLLSSYRSRAMHRIIQTLLKKKFDLIHLEPFYVWPSIPKTTLPIIVSEHNIESQVYRAYAMQPKRLWLRPLLFWDILKIHFWEKRVWRKVQSVTAVSQQDAKVIRQVIGRDVPVVSNGVDLEQFPFSAGLGNGKARRILFVGDFKWFPNRQAAWVLIHDIWPKVKKLYSEAQLSIVGRDMSPSFVTMVMRAGGQAHPDVADIALHYQDADIFVAPHTIAGGTKFKMLEAFASGLPVVTTPQGVAGIGVRAGREYLEATDAAGFVSQIQRLWCDKTVGQKITMAARRFVEKNYNWDSIADVLDQVWKKYETH